MEYQCSVLCHCDNPSIDVHCYGSFEYCEGVCPRCGATHVGKQIPLSSGGHRYVIEIKHTTMSRVLYFVELVKMVAGG